MSIFDPIGVRSGVLFSIFSGSNDTLILPPHSIFSGVYSGQFFEKLLKNSSWARLGVKNAKKVSKLTIFSLKNRKNPGELAQDVKRNFF